MQIKYWTALFMIGTTLAFSIDLDSMMSSKEKKSTGYDSLTSDEKKQLNTWISENFTPIPDTLGHTPLSLNINIDNGRVLILNDGSYWEVAPEDRKISSFWLTPFPLEITPRDSQAFPFFILNITTQEKVKARQIPQKTNSPNVK